MAVDAVLVATKIRFLLGDAEESVVSTATLSMVITEAITTLGSTDDKFHEVTYSSIITILRYLVRVNQKKSGAGSVGKRKEKMGKREVEITYSTVSSEETGWVQMLADFLKHPEFIDKSLLLLRPTLNTVRVGGVSHKAYDKVVDNTDSRNGFQFKASVSYDRPTIDHIRNRRH